MVHPAWAFLWDHIVVEGNLDMPACMLETDQSRNLLAKDPSLSNQTAEQEVRERGVGEEWEEEGARQGYRQLGRQKEFGGPRGPVVAVHVADIASYGQAPRAPRGPENSSAPFDHDRHALMAFAHETCNCDHRVPLNTLLIGVGLSTARSLAISCLCLLC